MTRLPSISSRFTRTIHTTIIKVATLEQSLKVVKSIAMCDAGGWLRALADPAHRQYSASLQRSDTWLGCTITGPAGYAMIHVRLHLSGDRRIDHLRFASRYIAIPLRRLYVNQWRIR
jgi:hypothetical protein